MKLESTIKRSRAARWAYHNFAGLYPTGAWLYRRKVVDWMTHRWAQEQLPTSFRLFAHFCRSQSWFPGRVLAGATAFRLTSRLHQTFNSTPLSIKVDGHRIYLNPDDPRMLQVPRELHQLVGANSVLARFLSPGDTFVDIGANHGAFSVAAAHFLGPRGLVLAFEPQPDLHRLVARSLEASEIREFRVFPDSCGERRGETEFFVPRKSSGRAGLFADFSARSHHKKIQVRQVRIDDIMQNLDLPGRVFIKLDVEGNELSALRGATGFIRTYRPRMLMELNPIAMKAAGTDYREVVALLHEMGWRSFRRLDDLDRLHPLGSLSSGWLENLVFDFEQPVHPSVHDHGRNTRY